MILKKGNFTFKFFGILILTAIGVSLFQRKSSSQVILVLHEENIVRYLDKQNASTEDFWNNFPYWVILSEGQRKEALKEKTDSILKATSIASFDKGIANDSYVYFKLIYSKNNATLNWAIIKEIESGAYPVIILTNKSTPFGYISGLRSIGIDSSRMVFDSSSPLPIENLGMSYFFSLDKNGVVSNVWVPRTEMIGIINKYLGLISVKKM